MKSVCVFCGSRPGVRPEYTESARRTGHLLAQHGMRLVYGGGRLGLMGTVADATLEAGGKVFGVIPDFLTRLEAAHLGVTELVTVASMHDRKLKMNEASDAFLILPGGLGTLEELYEIYSWCYLGLHAKPIGILNVAGFYNPMLEMLNHLVREGFVNDRTLEVLVIDEDPARLLDRMAAHQPPQMMVKLDDAQKA